MEGGASADKPPLVLTGSPNGGNRRGEVVPMQTAKWPLRVSAALWLATTCCAAEAVDLRDLAWLTGIWRGEMGGATTEEVWSAPMGDNMTWCTASCRMAGSGCTSS